MSEAIEFGGASYQVEAAYEFDDLPEEVQKDVKKSMGYRQKPQHFLYKLSLLTSRDAKELAWSLIAATGDSYEKESASRRTQSAMKAISSEGLKNPPVGTQGVHRLLAMIMLGWDSIPVFSIVAP